MTQGPVNDSITSLMRIVAKTGVPIFSVDYTLAPEAQAPVQVIEGYAALNYLVEREEFGVDRDRVGVMGESAGGTLAACLVHWTIMWYPYMTNDLVSVLTVQKYPKGPKFRKQILIYPMLDDRNITPDPDPDFRPQLWSHRDNARSWLAFLGDQASNEDIPPTSSPGRMTLEQARGLPSTYLDIGDKDIFRDECIEYCAKTAKAGVEIELHVLPGMGHAFDWLYTAKPTVQAVVRARYRAISGI